jgi:hypothetical protein
MNANVGEILPTAKDFMDKLARAQAQEAEKLARKMEEVEAKKRALVQQLTKSSGVSDEQAIRRAVQIIERAVSNGLTEVQVYRFPNTICTDRGRAINQGEKGWEATLTGVPKEIYELWQKYFQARGFKLKAEIVDFHEGMPGDVGLTLTWKDE